MLRMATMIKPSKYLFNAGFALFMLGIFADEQLGGLAELLVGLGMAGALAGVVVSFFYPPSYITKYSQSAVDGYRVTIDGFLISATAIGLAQIDVAPDIFNLTFKLGCALFVLGAVWCLLASWLR